MGLSIQFAQNKFTGGVQQMRRARFMLSESGAMTSDEVRAAFIQPSHSLACNDWVRLVKQAVSVVVHPRNRSRSNFQG